MENAKHEVELQLGSQKSNYEQEIQQLGATLEQQKLALEEMNLKKVELEMEVESNKRIRKIQSEHFASVSPYKSNFLEDVASVLNETTSDVETALKMKLSNKAMNVGGISLHEMQLLVREATARCRELGINYVSYMIF